VRVGLKELVLINCNNMLKVRKRESSGDVSKPEHVQAHDHELLRCPHPPSDTGAILSSTNQSSEKNQMDIRV
jgi:hypothetical protein